MGARINADGKFQSDKYPTCPAGKVPLSVTDPTAQDLLWEYAQRRRTVDGEFSNDLEMVLVGSGYVPPSPDGARDPSCMSTAEWMRWRANQLRKR